MTGIRHPREEDLAALADGRLGAGEAEPLRRHLAACRSCLAAYSDAVRYRAGWLTSPRAFEPSRGLVDRGMDVARNAGAARGAASVRVGPGGRVGWRSVALAGGALALVALGWYVLGAGITPR